MEATLVLQTVPPLEELEGFIHQHAHHCHKRLPISCRMDYDDLMQEGRMKYVELSSRFDPNRGIKFITYFFWGLKNHFIGIIQNDYNQHKADPRQGYTEFLRKRKGSGIEDIEAGEEISKRVTDMFTELLSRDAFLFTSELLNPSEEFLAFEKETFNHSSSNPKMLRNRIFSYFGWKGHKKQIVLSELRRKLIGNGWHD